MFKHALFGGKLDRVGPHRPIRERVVGGRVGAGGTSASAKRNVTRPTREITAARLPPSPSSHPTQFKFLIIIIMYNTKKDNKNEFCGNERKRERRNVHADMMTTVLLISRVDKGAYVPWRPDLGTSIINNFPKACGCISTSIPMIPIIIHLLSSS